MDHLDSKRFQGWATFLLVVAVGALLLPARAWAEDPSAVPEHAFIDYGKHWRCDRGFERLDDRCEKIHLPEHAFLSFSGDRWECERGLKRVSDRCQPVHVPEIAFLNESGEGWDCERGFRRSGSGCTPR